MSTQDKARALMQRHYQQVKHRQQSMLGRTGQELGMPVEIANYWNPIQGKLNPMARVLYNRNHVTFS
ncbi:hypothetical protein ACF3DV_29120 [Chlorogloeopsis fritschii PCC 9212]|uniref:hypothetical protein n=1 Tax=Chlorogloeopsis fritschii TaxID=1124 RepID=UPI00370D2D3F